MQNAKFLAIVVILYLLISNVIIFQNIQFFNENKENQLTLEADDKHDFKSKYIEDTNLRTKLTDTVPITLTLLDAINGDPVSNAQVIVYNDTYSTIIFTDSNGNIFLAIELGLYLLNMSANGYVSSLQVDAYFFSPATYIYYLEPFNAVGITSNDIVLENSEYFLTYQSTTNGSIFNYSIYINSALIMTIYSNSLVLSPMSPGIYNITVLMNSTYGFFTDQIDLYVTGFKFTNLANGSVVNGGLILIQFEYAQDYTPAPLQFHYLLARVNDVQYLITNSFEIRNVALPVFDNGTNDFHFIFDFQTLGQLQYDLIVYAENVVPALDVAVGDYWNYSIKTLDPGSYSGTQQDVYIYVEDKISTFLVNLTISVSIYNIINNSLISSRNDWMIVNTINGYVEDGGGVLNLPIDTLWLIFTGLQNGYSDIITFNSFYNVGFKVSESSYNGIKTWSTNMSALSPGFTWNGQYIQSSGILLYLSFSFNALQLQEIKLIASTYLPTIPSLVYNDMTITQGSSSKLSWNIEGSYSGNYTVYVDSIVAKNDYWSSGLETVYDLSSLPEGDHNVTAVFVNTFGQFSIYYTIIHVMAGSPPVISTVTTTVSTTIPVTETSTTVSTSTSTTTKTSTTTSTSIQTTISTIITEIINTTTKTTTGFSIVILVLGISGALFIRRKRNRMS